jgi:hypothetical protein
LYEEEEEEENVDDVAQKSSRSTVGIYINKVFCHDCNKII